MNGWKRLLDRIPPETRAPAAVSLAFAAAIALEVAGLAARVSSGTPSIMAAHAFPASARRNPVDVNRIMAAHLFGDFRSDPANAPESQASLLLAGTIALGNTGRGYALIAESGGASKLYSVGARTADGSVLQQVFPDHVVLDRQASLEKLTMKKWGSAPAVERANTAAPAITDAPSAMAANTVDAAPSMRAAASPEAYAPGNKPWE